LHLGVERNNRNVLIVLLAVPNLKLDARDAKGRTALTAALQSERIEMAKLLLDARCDVNARDARGGSTILHAAKVHDADLCRLLFQCRADPNVSDPADGSHVLHLAAQMRNASLMRALLAAHADLHIPHPRNGRTPLHLIAGTRMTPLVSTLLDLRADVDARNDVGDTSLRMAVQSCDIKTIELLCTARADPNGANRSGCAPIHAAVASGDVEVVQLLTKFKADVHLADSRRWRPMHYSTCGGNDKVSDWLVKNGADPIVKSCFGRTPQRFFQDDATQLVTSSNFKNRRPKATKALSMPPIQSPVLFGRCVRPRPCRRLNNKVQLDGCSVTGTPLDWASVSELVTTVSGELSMKMESLPHLTLSSKTATSHALGTLVEASVPM